MPVLQNLTSFLNLKLDSGAQFAVLSRDVLEQAKIDGLSKFRVSGGRGVVAPFEVVFGTTIFLDFNDVALKLKVRVVDTFPVPLLLGADIVKFSNCRYIERARSPKGRSFIVS